MLKPRTMQAALIAIAVLAGVSAPSFNAAIAQTQASSLQGDVVLTISGAIENAPDDGAMALDMQALEALGSIEFDTSTIWIEGKTRFVGTPLRTILEHAGATGDTIEAVALNDYKIDIPIDEIGERFPIVAYKKNGKPMSPRGKGPLWIVYPYDFGPVFQTDVIYSRSIWQLNRIAVKD